METTFSRAIGDTVYFIDENNCIHKTLITQAKVETILNKNNETVIREYFTVKGKGLNNWFHVSVLYSTPEEAGAYLATKIVDDVTR